ncbi:MAG: MinD/ParA family protein [Christensenellales bacterium]
MDQAQNLRNIMEKNKHAGIKVVTVTSAKGGVGKSSFTLNFAIALSKRGKRVLIVDMDFGLANIDVMLGIKTKYDLSNVILDQVDIRQVIEQGLNGIQFVSGGSGVYDLMKLNTQQLNGVIENLLKLDDLADTIIFDTGAGVNDHIVRLICASHETLLVTTPEPTAIMDAYALMKIVSREKIKPPVRLIVNKAENEKEALAVMSGFIRIVQKYTEMKIDDLGYILRDENMVKAVKLQVPLMESFSRSVAAVNIENLANRYLSCADKVNLGFGGFLDRLLGKKHVSRE